MRNGFWLTISLVLSVTLICGCGQTGSAPALVETQTSAHEDHGHPQHTATTMTAGHDHSEWWCNEHGVPEEVCALCNSKVAAEFQKKSDWCAEHDRPDSQCFLCHPELEAKYSAKYEARYGKQPPKRAG